MASGLGAQGMKRRHIVATALAAAVNICALAYGLGGLIVSGFATSASGTGGPAVAAAGPGAPR